MIKVSSIDELEVLKKIFDDKETLIHDIDARSKKILINLTVSLEKADFLEIQQGE